MPEIRLHREGAIAWITIDHQERLNALTPEMTDRLGEAFDEVAADRQVRAVVLTGAGSKAFASGGDVSRFEETRKDYAATQAAAARRAATNGKMVAMEKPVVAMIRGYCMGGGMALALHADLRFASSDAVLGIPAARLGIAYSVPGIEKLTELVGLSAAKDILFSGRRVKAGEAMALGLLDRVVEPDALENVTRAYCEMLAKNAPLSIRSSKVILGELSKPASRRDTQRIEQVQRDAADSEDIKEGRNAFAEKREPVFVGR